MVTRINLLLEQKNISKSKFYEDCKLPNNALTKWNNSIPSALTLLTVAKYLGTTVEYLLTGQEENITSKDRELLSDFHKLKTEYQNIIITNISMMKDLSWLLYSRVFKKEII